MVITKRFDLEVFDVRGITVAVAGLMIFVTAPCLGQEKDTLEQESCKTPDMHVCGPKEGEKGESIQGRFYLFNPRSFRTNSSNKGIPVFLNITNDGQALLKGELKGLTLSDATKLFGAANSSALGDYKTFDVSGKWAVDRSEKHPFQIDMKFIRDTLQCYRVRGTKITDPEWTIVDSSL
jgi:hypothetical protein